MLSPKVKRNVLRIIPFGVIWLIFSVVYSLVERGILANLTAYPATGNPYNFSRSIVITALTTLLSGLLIGTIEILYLSRLFVRKSFSKKLLYKTMIYAAIIILFLLMNTVIYNAVELQKGIFSSLVWRNAWAFFATYSFWGIEVYIAAIIIISLFYTEVSENLGVAVLNNFFTGKYHTPVEEERVFMFLDMKSSTTIAESLGHVKYFQMLKEYYADLSSPIINYSGEVYQYVGDEIVVSWSLKNGLQHNNCIECFFAMKAAIKKQHKKYSEKFGLLPGFKAGFHAGKVTTGEIGIIKKDIIFTGDVLNTTARIQGLCNSYKVDLLISDELMKELHLRSHFQITPLGENELRGRDERVKLFTIVPFPDRSVNR